MISCLNARRGGRQGVATVFMIDKVLGAKLL